MPRIRHPVPYAVPIPPRGRIMRLGSQNNGAARIMAENPTEVVAGAAVLAAALVFVFYASQSTGLSGNAGTYDLKASFRSVEGITDRKSVV